MRRVLMILLVLLLLYLAAVVYLVARSTNGALKVGPVSEALQALPRPSDPYQLGYSGDPGIALGLDFESVVVETELGAAPAWLVPADPDARLAAIYIHGIAGARENGYRFLPLLHGAGVPVLLASYRNDPDAPMSPERRYQFGLTEWRDLEAAVGFLEQRGYHQQIVIADSMGGAILGQFLAQSSKTEAIVGVAMDAPALDLVAIVMTLGAAHRAPLTSVAVPVASWLMARAGHFDIRAARVSEPFEDFPGPVFLAHGSEDSIVPVATTQRLVARRQGVTVLLQTGGDHLDSFAEDPLRYGQAFRAFLLPLLQ